MLKESLVALALGFLLALPAAFPAMAHDDATLDAMASPHNGQIRMAGPYHFELVVGEKQLTVYLTDHAMQPIATQGVSGSAVVLSDGKSTLDMKPAGDNVLKGQGEFKAGPEMKVVLSLNFPDSSSWQAKFTPWEKMQAAKVGATPSPAPAPAAADEHAGHH